MCTPTSSQPGFSSTFCRLLRNSSTSRHCQGLVGCRHSTILTNISPPIHRTSNDSLAARRHKLGLTVLTSPGLCKLPGQVFKSSRPSLPPGSVQCRSLLYPKSLLGPVVNLLEMVDARYYAKKLTGTELKAAADAGSCNIGSLGMVPRPAMGSSSFTLSLEDL